ncbi:hypothetical protein RclHR1_05380003 [Rhizophagus clarus]|uniref:Uncharacterized protein n=1 Tax=Rhizophagus clarus TaxID=94130 RepID=A0A2Z6RLZ6_9GLOM|nr:hypothetical protein RclHR1_05380003 [Rhizophagus clarus]
MYQAIIICYYHFSYNLNERLHEQFNWNENAFDNKKIKLDTLNDRKELFNKRASFTNLVSSASLILPPKVDTVVITKDKFVVEWIQNPDTITKIPPTQVKQVLYEDDRIELGNEIHQNSFKIPVYYCNSVTPNNIIKKINEEKRMLINSQINDTKTSLSSAQIEIYSEITKKTLKKTAIYDKSNTSYFEQYVDYIATEHEEVPDYLIPLNPPPAPMLIQDKHDANFMRHFEAATDYILYAATACTRLRVSEKIAHRSRLR